MSPLPRSVPDTSTPTQQTDMGQATSTVETQQAGHIRVPPLSKAASRTYPCTTIVYGRSRTYPCTTIVNSSKQDISVYHHCQQQKAGHIRVEPLSTAASRTYPCTTIVNSSKQDISVYHHCQQQKAGHIRVEPLSTAASRTYPCTTIVNSSKQDISVYHHCQQQQAGHIRVEPLSTAASRTYPCRTIVYSSEQDISVYHHFQQQQAGHIRVEPLSTAASGTYPCTFCPDRAGELSSYTGETMCTDKGDRLVWLDTALKDAFFRTFARLNGDSFWTGGYRTGSGTWAWSGGEQMCNRGWFDSQPDGSGDCMAVANWYDWQWDDVSCWDSMRPACERPIFTAVGGCGQQLATSTPVALPTASPGDAESTGTEVASTSPDSWTVIRSVSTPTGVESSSLTLRTSKFTDDVLYVSTPTSTTLHPSPVDSETRQSTGIMLGGSSSMAQSSTTVTNELLHANNRGLGIGSSSTSLFNMETYVYSMEPGGLTSSYVIESLDSNAYLFESSGSTIEPSSPTVDPSGFAIASSTYVIESLDSNAYPYESSGSTIEPSSLTVDPSGFTIGSSNHVIESLDSSAYPYESSGSTTKPSGLTVQPSGFTIGSSSSTIESSIHSISSSGYAVPSLTGSILETNYDKGLPLTDETGETSVVSSASVIADSADHQYTTLPLPSRSQPTSSTTPATRPCRCFCDARHRYDALKSVDLHQRKEDIRESLLLNTRGLASFEARYTSADDHRPSSFTIASMGIIILVAYDIHEKKSSIAGRSAMCPDDSFRPSSHPSRKSSDLLNGQLQPFQVMSCLQLGQIL
ncbi:serine-rich adhesin for platelets-like [Haliotis cracherodii]|uniref:serine-rich adhesin for platelets-like n=1 Tax=Haliotis cracherodii TaxID=6455 RepID=UPI0039E8FD57